MAFTGLFFQAVVTIKATRVNRHDECSDQHSKRIVE